MKTAILLVATSLLLSSCGQAPPDFKKELIGSWKLQGVGTIYQFTADGRFLWTSQIGRTYSGTYRWIDENHFQSHSVLNAGRPQTYEVEEITQNTMKASDWPVSFTFDRVQDNAAAP